MCLKISAFSAHTKISYAYSSSALSRKSLNVISALVVGPICQEVTICVVTWRDMTMKLLAHYKFTNYTKLYSKQLIFI